MSELVNDEPPFHSGKRARFRHVAGYAYVEGASTNYLELSRVIYPSYYYYYHHHHHHYHDNRHNHCRADYIDW
jgi:hypothetical protein